MSIQKFNPSGHWEYFDTREQQVAILPVVEIDRQKTKSKNTKCYAFRDMAYRLVFLVFLN